MVIKRKEFYKKTSKGYEEFKKPGKATRVD
jgi:hypothetical protein